MKKIKHTKSIWILALAFLAFACTAADDPIDTPTPPTPEQGQVPDNNGDDNNGDDNNGATDNAEVAPNFSLADTDGNTVSLKDFEDKVLVLFFFGYNCPLCKASGPHVQTQLANKYSSNSNFEIIGLDIWNGNVSGVKSFKSTTNISFPLLLKASATGGDYKTSYDRLVVIDKLGKIRFKGQRNATNDLEAVIDTVQTYLDK